MISLPDLAEKLASLGIMQKRFCDLSREEVQDLCTAVLSSPDTGKVPAEGWKQPYLYDLDLIIPWDVHPSYYWWIPGRKSLADILKELNAPPEMYKKFNVVEIDEVPF